MRSKLPQAHLKTEERPESQHLLSEKAEVPINYTMKLEPGSFSKDKLYVTFTGVIESGIVNDQDSISLRFTIEAAEHWKVVNGMKTGISQIASSFSSDNKRIVWNMPFEITFETTDLSGWPQIVFVLEGSDFFGRSAVRAYGNLHLPCSTGNHQRKVQLFKPLPQSLITEICGFLNGKIAEYKQPQKVLTSGDGREVTRVESMGELSLVVQTTRYNFGLYNYS